MKASLRSLNQTKRKYLYGSRWFMKDARKLHFVFDGTNVGGHKRLHIVAWSIEKQFVVWCGRQAKVVIT